MIEWKKLLQGIAILILLIILINAGLICRQAVVVVVMNAMVTDGYYASGFYVFHQATVLISLLSLSLVFS